MQRSLPAEVSGIKRRLVSELARERDIHDDAVRVSSGGEAGGGDVALRVGACLSEAGVTGKLGVTFTLCVSTSGLS